MSAITPRVSPTLKEKIRPLAEDPSTLADRILSRLMQSDSDYSGLPSEARQDVKESIRMYSSLWFQCLYEGRTIHESEIERLAASGRRRFHQGINLNSLLRAFRAGSREMLEAYLNIGRDNKDLRDELLFNLSPSLLEYIDLLSLSIAQAFLQEQFQGTRWRDARRYELCSIIFSPQPDLDGFNRTCCALGHDAQGLRLAIAVELDFESVTLGDLEVEAERLASGVAYHLNTTPNNLIYVMRYGRLLVWLPCARGDSILASDQYMRSSMESFLASNDTIKTIGVGLMNQEPSGWAASAHEALKSIEVGAAISSTRRVHYYSDIVINESVKASRTALRYLDSLIERLTPEPDLIFTLETFFEHSQKHKVTASALNIHPNTLSYRLDRVMSLLGAKLTDIDFMASLRIALKLRRESSRPEPRE